MKIKSDSLSVGLLTGCIAPPLAFFIFSLFAFPENSAFDILQGYAKRNVLTHIISLAVLINLPVFFIFLNTSRDRSARGIIGATILYAFIIVILKLT